MAKVFGIERPISVGILLRYKEIPKLTSLFYPSLIFTGKVSKILDKFENNGPAYCNKAKLWHGKQKILHC
jgi:hypothetical protein